MYLFQRIEEADFKQAAELIQKAQNVVIYGTSLKDLSKQF